MRVGLLVFSDGVDFLPAGDDVLSLGDNHVQRLPEPDKVAGGYTCKKVMFHVFIQPAVEKPGDGKDLDPPGAQSLIVGIVHHGDMLSTVIEGADGVADLRSQHKKQDQVPAAQEDTSSQNRGIDNQNSQGLAPDKF